MGNKVTLSQIAQLTRRIAEGQYDRETLQAILERRFEVTAYRPNAIVEEHRAKSAFKLLSLEEQIDRLSGYAVGESALSSLAGLKEAAGSMALPEGADGFLVVEKHLRRTLEGAAQPLDSAYAFFGGSNAGDFKVNSSHGLVLGMPYDAIAYYGRLEGRTPGDYLALPIALGWKVIGDTDVPPEVARRRIYLNSCAVATLIATHWHVLTDGVSRDFRCLGDMPIMGDKPLVPDKDHVFESDWFVYGSQVTHNITYRHEEDARLFILAYFAPYIVLL